MDKTLSASPLTFSANKALYLEIKKLFVLQDIEAKKEAQKEKEIDEQEANASTMHRCRTMLDKDLINTGIYESAGKQSLPLVQLVQQLLRYLLAWVAHAKQCHSAYRHPSNSL